jgi:hypothetical protein
MDGDLGTDVEFYDYFIIAIRTSFGDYAISDIENELFSDPHKVLN